MMFSKEWCPYCDEAKEILTDKNIEFNFIEVDKDNNFSQNDGKIIS